MFENFAYHELIQEQIRLIKLSDEFFHEGDNDIAGEYFLSARLVMEEIEVRILKTAI